MKKRKNAPEGATFSNGGSSAMSSKNGSKDNSKGSNGNSRDSTSNSSSTPCPYLTTISRPALSFDAPPMCSVTLQSSHIYICLVCGQYFRGRGKGTPAYDHSLEADHMIFMGVGGTEDDEDGAVSAKGRVFCLPDGYEVFDNSLNDIRAAMDPKYTLEQIKSLDDNKTLARDIHGSQVSLCKRWHGCNSVVTLMSL